MVSHVVNSSEHIKVKYMIWNQCSKKIQDKSRKQVVLATHFKQQYLSEKIRHYKSRFICGNCANHAGVCMISNDVILLHNVGCNPAPCNFANITSRERQICVRSFSSYGTLRIDNVKIFGAMRWFLMDHCSALDWIRKIRYLGQLIRERLLNSHLINTLKLILNAGDKVDARSEDTHWNWFVCVYEPCGSLSARCRLRFTFNKCS